MSIKTWLAEFYPTDAEAFPPTRTTPSAGTLPR